MNLLALASAFRATLSLSDRLHFLHRAWRYRLLSEKFAIAYMRGRDLQGTTVVDIGANRGIYSYWMHKLAGPKGRVIAFEPQPELADELVKLRRSFGLNRLEIAQLGLSSEPASRKLARPKTHWGGASLEVQHGDVDWLSIQVTTLDRYFAERGDRPVRFIKCDVEGHELQVFQGGKELLLKDRPTLLFECWQGANPQCPTFVYLQSLGYAGFCFARDGLAPVAEYPHLRAHMHRHALADFVFLPNEAQAGLKRFKIA